MCVSITTLRMVRATLRVYERAGLLRIFFKEFFIILDIRERMKTIFSIRCSFHERALYFILFFSKEIRLLSRQKNSNSFLNEQKRREFVSYRFSYNIDIENSLKQFQKESDICVLHLFLFSEILISQKERKIAWNAFLGKSTMEMETEYTGSPWSIHRLTLELVTVGDFALPVTGLFVQIKGQPAGARDLLQAGFRAPVRVGQKTKGTPFNQIEICMYRLLSSWSQFFTFVFQSHVCLSMSNARPVGHRTVANLVTPISLALSHL